MEPTIINPYTNKEQKLAFVRDPQGYIIEIRASDATRGFISQEYAQQSKENIKVR